MIMPLSMAAGQRGVFLATAAATGAIMFERSRAGDASLATGPIPQCWVCGQNLTASFRKAGVHPECLYGLGE